MAPARNCENLIFLVDIGALREYINNMRVTTSITISEQLLKEVDALAQAPNQRSVFIETALREYLKRKRREARDRNDLELINNAAAELNKEAEDVLSYQVDI